VPNLDQQLRELADEAGFDGYGVCVAEDFLYERQAIEANLAEGLNADMRFVYGDPVRATSPQLLVPEAAVVISIASRYILTAPTSAATCQGESVTANQGVVARYAWIDPYRELKRSLKPMVQLLKSQGFRARALADDNVLVDRAAAVRAGLGWFGRNSTVLLHGKGSWFTLANIVTNAPLTPTAAPPKSLLSPGLGCGNCEACIPACPTGALDRTGRLDARRCLSWLLQSREQFPIEFREALGGRIYGCDDCQTSCPPNNVAVKLSPPPQADVSACHTVDLVAALSMTDQQLLERFDHWYIADRDAVWLRRNFLLALGNVGDPDDAGVAVAIERYHAHSHVQVADAARWATGRLAQRRLTESSTNLFSA